jgi:hypothetical protein
MRLAEHVALMGGVEVYTGFWWGNLTERDHLEDPDIDGRIILKWIFRKRDRGALVISWVQDLMAPMHLSLTRFFVPHIKGAPKPH